MTVWMLAVGAGVVSALAVLVLTRVIIPLAHRHNWLDRPDERKRHHTPTPPLGGVAIFIVFWIVTAIVSLLYPESLSSFLPHLGIISAGGCVIFLLGLYDDFRPLNAWVKLAVEAIIGVVFWGAGLGIELIWVPTIGGVATGILSLPLTVAWFILLVNAVNIIDGLDGLAGGVVLIGLACIVIIGIRLAIPDTIILAATMAGTLVGFLYYNRPPARIFLGDNGSLFLGYFFAVLALWIPIKRYTVVAVYVPVLAALVPLAEAGWSVVRRLGSRRHPVKADRGHLHYRLMERGMSARAVRALFYALSAVGVLFSLAAAYGNRRLWLMIFGFFVLLLIGALYILMRTSPRR